MEWAMSQGMWECLGPRKGKEIDSFLEPPEKKCQHLDQTCIRLLNYRTLRQYICVFYATETMGICYSSNRNRIH